MSRWGSLLAAAAMSVTSALALTGPAQATPESTKPATADTLRAAAECYVDGDGMLHCGNERNTPLKEHRSYSSTTVDWVETTFSVFACWGYGDHHEGGNNIWYWTNGDHYGRWGNAPASWVYTSVDPPAGMKQC